MKKQIYRIMSGLCAAMLLVPTMALTAFAATPTFTKIVGGATAVGVSGAQDVFYYELTPMPTQDDTTTAITGFEPTVDWLVFDAPAGTTISVGTAATSDSGKVFLTDSTNTNTKKQILTVSGIASTRIIGTTTPILRDISVAGLTNGKVEKGNSVILTATASTYNATAATPTVVTWSSGATGTAVLTVDTSTLALGKHTYTATLGTDSKSVTIEVIACPATLTSVAINSSAGNTVNVTSAKDITFTATPTFSGVCTLPGGAAHDKNATTVWSYNPLPTGVAMNGNRLSVTKALAVGSYPITVTATATANGNSKIGSYQITINMNEFCGATVTDVSISNMPSDAKLTLQANTAGEVHPQANYIIAGNGCTTAGHTTDATHGLKPSVIWSLENPVAGVNIDATTGLVKVDTTVPNNTAVQVKATLNNSLAKSVTTSAVAPFAVLRTGEACGMTANGIGITNPPTPIHMGIGVSSVTQYNATITFNTGECNLAAHTGDSNHGQKPTSWTVTNKGNTTKPAFADITAGGALTITTANMPSASQVIILTATFGGYTSAPVEVTVTRTPVCNKVLSTVAGSIGAVTPGAVAPTTSKLIYERNRTVLSAIDADVTLALTLGKGPVFTGSCDYEQGAVGTDITAANHKVTWSIAGPPAGVTIAPATDSATGILTIKRDSLATVQTTVSITATVNGTSTPVGYIVVHKGYYSPPSSGSSADREEQLREEQYKKIENQIEDADRKDIIKATLTDNPDFPARIMRELKGQDVNLELYVGNGFTWKINGKNLNKIPDYQLYISMEAKKIKDSDISSKAKDHDIKIIDLGHNGSFYGTYNLQMDAGSGYAKKTVYLYKHIDNSSKLSYRGAAKVDSDGYVIFPFTSASTYVMTDRALYGETASTLPSGGGGSTTTPIAPTIPSASVAPPALPSSSVSSEIPSEPSSEISSSSSDEPSKPADVEPEEDTKPEKKKTKIPIIIPILIVVVTITVVAVVLLAKGGGMNVG